MKDKVAIISGAASGIGRATAQLFARCGARVVVAAQAILFLASDSSRFMTGSELIIDGGYTAQ